MRPDETTPQEEELAALLGAFDDALAAGAPPPLDDAAAMGPRLQENLQCLQLLHLLRPGAELDKETRTQGDKERTAGSVSVSEEEEGAERYTLTRVHAVGGIGRV